MQYLKIKRPKNKKRADGTQMACPIWVTRPRKFSKRTTEKTISVRSSILVTGAHDSGKTRFVSRLAENWRGIWGAKIKSEPVHLGAFNPISQWIEQEPVINWHNLQVKNALEQYSDEPNKHLLPWNKCRPWEREAALVNYITIEQPIVFLDDAHKLTGRKLALARNCILSSKLFVVSARSSQRIAPNLRAAIERREPQIFNLSTNVAYDATKIIMWFMSTILLLMGWWQAALVMGGLTALGSGKLATKQD